MDWLPEQFFHYLWRLRLFNNQALQTTDGAALQVLQPGTINPHSGADFDDARIYIDNMLWAGTVEIHRCSSDWWRHRHQGNIQYDNVILHVVYKDDSKQKIVRSNGSVIPTLELQNRIPADIARRYWTLLQTPDWIPCEKQIATAPTIVLESWLERLVVERLEQKIAQIQHALQLNHNDWEQTFYESLSRSLGSKVNAQPMEQIARALPQLLLAKHKESLFQLEALLLGQAGLLGAEHSEEQPKQWWREFQHLKSKYQLQPLSVGVWKTAKLRPQNFPAVRLAQLARLVYQSVHLFSKVLEINSLPEIYELLHVELTDYWLTHFVLNEPSPKQEQKTLGKATIESIAINTIIPFLFAYGKAKAEEAFVKKALLLLAALPAEQNAVIDHWADLGIKAANAQQSQALLQLKSDYCDERNCLKCAVGHAILKR